MATSATTGCRRTTPSVALETLLELPPLHIFIVREAALAAYRLLMDIRPKPGDYMGHLRIYERFPDLVGMREASDQMPLGFEFEMSFSLAIPDRMEWQGGSCPIEENSKVFYTDGSKQGERTGAEIYGPGIRAWFPMGTSATVFDAEVCAIDTCARRCLARNDLRRKRITIASDSQAALRALGALTFKSKLVLECRRNLNKLGSQCQLTLVWVPGHRGIAGNEAADELAKRGSETDFIGPEPFCGFGLGSRREMLRRWEEQEMKGNFGGLDIDSHSRNFMHYSDRRADEALALSRQDLRLLVGILSGHCGLRAHQHRINKSDVGVCRFCLVGQETPLHFLCECEALARKRNISLGKGFPTMLDIKQMKFQMVVNFFKRLDLEI